MQRTIPDKVPIENGKVADWPLSAVEIVPIALLLPSDSPRTGGEDPKHVRVLAEAEAPLPSIIVHRPTMKVVDGMHRLKAARARGDRKIAARFFDGDEADAFVLAVRSNVAHGLPLSAADRAAAAQRIIKSHPIWSDRAIALIAGLSDKTVKRIRTATGGDAVVAAARVGRDGRRRPVDGAAGRLKAKEWIERLPDASTREIAELAGVSPATARDVRNRLSRGEDPLPTSQQKAQLRQPPPPLIRRRQPPHSVEDRAVEDFAKELTSLLKDPSLKLTENGRALLRGLTLQRHIRARQAELAKAIPQHRAETVSKLARECAASWLRLAEEAEQRATAMSPRVKRRR